MILFALLMPGSAVPVVKLLIRRFLPIALVITMSSSVELKAFKDIRPGAKALGFYFVFSPDFSG
jgi:hypothetical protein